MKIYYDSTLTLFKSCLSQAGLPSDKALRCAEIFAQNTFDGVVSHGINRFPAFIQSIVDGTINTSARMTKSGEYGCLEQWDGQSGIGPLNAEHAMKRAMTLAKANGLGCVGLRHSNHWMRAGTYSGLAADANYIGICWTNTIALMPPWGGKKNLIGNNPMSIAIPKADGHIVLDMAMSQYAFGKLEVLQRLGETLPLPGGFDSHGVLSTKPSDILNGGQALPIGYWKGSGLAVMLDLLAMILSGGISTKEISKQNNETNVSQAFIAINAKHLLTEDLSERVQSVISDFTNVDEKTVHYPGQQMKKNREKNMEQGMEIDDALWHQISLMQS